MLEVESLAPLGEVGCHHRKHRLHYHRDDTPQQAFVCCRRFYGFGTTWNAAKTGSHWPFAVTPSYTDTPYIASQEYQLPII